MTASSSIEHSVALIGRLGAQHNFRLHPSQPKVAGARTLLIIPAVLRRLHVPTVFAGEITLDPAQARHARDVLRLTSGTTVEVFDDAGVVATGELIVSPRAVAVRVDAGAVARRADARTSFEWTIAAAVPKGERADWMIEKLSELGTAKFIPLASARAVVLPEGKNKRDRWIRIATESAKQSRRAGVMQIGELTRVEEVVATIAAAQDTAGWYFSTAVDARPIDDVATSVVKKARSIVCLIGPEGGWTNEEIADFAAAGLTAVRLTDTVLRVETAAVAAAAVLGSVVTRQRQRS
jgi:16S rRNA (uracil1498-N3)-methyltransferase